MVMQYVSAHTVKAIGPLPIPSPQKPYFFHHACGKRVMAPGVTVQAVEKAAVRRGLIPLRLLFDTGAEVHRLAA